MPKQLINEMTNVEDPEIKSLAHGVNENVLKAQERMKQTSVRIGGQLPGFSGKVQHVEDIRKEDTPTMTSPLTTAWRLPAQAHP